MSQANNVKVLLGLSPHLTLSRGSRCIFCLRTEGLWEGLLWVSLRTPSAFVPGSLRSRRSSSAGQEPAPRDAAALSHRHPRGADRAVGPAAGRDRAHRALCSEQALGTGPQVPGAERLLPPSARAGGAGSACGRDTGDACGCQGRPILHRAVTGT